MFVFLQSILSHERMLLVVLLLDLLVCKLVVGGKSCFPMLRRLSILKLHWQYNNKCYAESIGRWVFVLTAYCHLRPDTVYL